MSLWFECETDHAISGCFVDKIKDKTTKKSELNSKKKNLKDHLGAQTAEVTFVVESLNDEKRSIRATGNTKWQVRNLTFGFKSFKRPTCIQSNITLSHSSG